MTGADPEVSVIVPTRDRPDQLTACLAALEQQTASSFEIVVVDDGSSDAAAVAAVVAAAPHARLLRGSGRGPAAARNLGASVARAPALCFTDDDCRPGTRWIEALAGRMDAAAPAVAGPTYNGQPRNVFAVASQTITNHLTEASYDPAVDGVRFAPTSNLACQAALHRTLRFDEGYRSAAGEDRDWCTRLVDRGLVLAFDPSAWVTHHQSLSFAGFWRQQVRYGRGAYRCHRGRGPRARLQTPAFYVRLAGKGFAAGLAAGLLVVLAQCATAVGMAREALAARRPDW
ncbi:MAG: glycosyltransferase family 2 protein [Acidimicrobiales bacterium]